MNRADIEKLLGGYAAGTLTPDERDKLFAAALDDQQLFESLAAEESLRELLQDSAARAQLLAALDNRPVPWFRRVLAPAFGVVAATVMILMAVFSRHELPKAEPVVVAETRREPVKSFQAPLPVAGSPLPTSLPPPPQLPAAAPDAKELDALARTPAPAPPAPPAPIAPAAPSPLAKQNLAEPLSADAEEAKTAEAKTAKVSQPVLQTAARPAFRELNFVGVGGSADAARLGLQYTVYTKSADGELTEVGPQTELERSDEVVIRFESRMAGFLSVSRLDDPNGPRLIANEPLQASVPYTVPAGGASQLLVRFSRVQAALKAQPGAAGQAGGVVSRASEPGAQQATFNITLKYK